PCDSLAKLTLANTTITNAQLVPTGAFHLPSGRRPRASVEMFSDFDRLPMFCRVQATVAPSRDSRIRVEVWLPVTGWNGRYLGVGNGGYAGSEEHTSELQSRRDLVCRLLLEKKKRDY